MTEMLTVYMTTWDRLAGNRISNGRVVQVSREKPAYIEVDSKHHTAIPTQKLVEQYQSDLIDDVAFERKYKAHLSDRDWLVIDGIRDGDNLVAWENPEDWCASRILAKWLCERGVGVVVVLDAPLDGEPNATERLFPTGKQE